MCAIGKEISLFCIYKFLFPYTLGLLSIGHLVVKFFLAKRGTQGRFLVSTRSAGVKVLV